MKNYFEGWYFKHQSKDKTLALIPGRTSSDAFIQIITNDRSYYVPYSLSLYSKDKHVQIGGSVFSRNKIKLAIHTETVDLSGELIYNDITPLKSDIMGPFQFCPMECRHAVISMHHRVSGAVILGGQELDFNGGIGYIEADSGRSFPENYTWVQSVDFDEKCSVMVSVAKIPFMGLHFQGVICAVWYGGIEYRLATYLGAKVIRRTKNELELEQGNLRLTVYVQNDSGQKLYAPQQGEMCRSIHESVATKARFIFRIDGKILFDKQSENTSFEHVLQ